MIDVLDITKALSDTTRVRLLMAVVEHELCVCQVTELTQLAFSTVSKHVGILRQAGLVESRKEGRWVFYRVIREPSPEAQGALAWLKKCLKNDKLIAADARRLRTILATDPEELCRKLATH